MIYIWLIYIFQVINVKGRREYMLNKKHSESANLRHA